MAKLDEARLRLWEAMLAEHPRQTMFRVSREELYDFVEIVRAAWAEWEGFMENLRRLEAMRLR